MDLPLRTRRSFLRELPLMVLGACSLFSQTVPLEHTTSLRKRAADRGLLYGAAAVRRTLANDDEYARSFVQQCGTLATDWEAKWNILHPTPTTFDFASADWLYHFAANHHLLFRAHTLLWHLDLPSWFQSQVNRTNASDLLLNYIDVVVGHFRGKVFSWDVANEIIQPADGRPDGLRISPWLRLVGTDYVEIAFRRAAQADPTALLVYNEDSLEYDTPYGDKKRAAVLNFLERLTSQNVPVHALGIEAHLNAEGRPFSAAKISRFLKEVSAMGLKIMVTEMDVDDRSVAAPINVRDQKVADEYARFLAPVLDNTSVTAVLTWGLSDRYTWLSKYSSQSGVRSARPLPLDHELKPKAAWYAIAQAFDNAPLRT